MIQATADRLRIYFRRRYIAYNQVFAKGVHRDIVLRDLAKFCRAHESTFHKDERASAVMQGRQEVWLRIQDQINLSLDEIYSLHAIKDKGDE